MLLDLGVGDWNSKPLHTYFLALTTMLLYIIIVIIYKIIRCMWNLDFSHSGHTTTRQRSIICCSACSSTIRWDTFICCVTRNSMSSYVVPNWNNAPDSWAISEMSGYVNTLLYTVSTPLPCCDCAVIIGCDSWMSSNVEVGFCKGNFEVSFSYRR